MKRTKRNSIRLIALGFAVAAFLPVAAQAKPISSDRYLPANAQGILVPGEIPYLSQGVGVDPSYYGGDSSSAPKSIVIPYMSQGQGVTAAEFGAGSGQSSDDRSFSRATSVGTPVVDTNDGSSINWQDYTVTGFALGLILVMGGLTFAVWHRRDRLSPA
jgi:hypothetical protein